MIIGSATRFLQVGSGGSNPAGLASRSFDGGDWIDTNSETIAGGLFAETGNPFSVAAWVKGPVTSLDTFVSRAGNASFNARTFEMKTRGDGFLNIQLRGANTALGSVPSGWFNLAVTWDGTSAIAYLNSSSTSLSVGAVAEESGENILIGARNGGSSDLLTGSLADLRFYNRALSSGEITDLYGAENITSGLDAHYLGNDDNVLDLTGNGNHATNNGSTFSTDGPFD